MSKECAICTIRDLIEQVVLKDTTFPVSVTVNIVKRECSQENSALNTIRGITGGEMWHRIRWSYIFVILIILGVIVALGLSVISRIRTQQADSGDLRPIRGKRGIGMSPISLPKTVTSDFKHKTRGNGLHSAQTLKCLKTALSRKAEILMFDPSLSLIFNAFKIEPDLVTFFYAGRYYELTRAAKSKKFRGLERILSDKLGVRVEIVGPR